MKDPRRPWAVLLYFLFIHVFLSYVPVPPVLLWTIGIFGGLFPFLYWAGTPGSPQREKRGWRGERFPELPSWVWILPILGTVIFHLLFLTSFRNWPLLDEGVDSYFALRLHENWNWYPFFDFNQMPPLYLWLLALSFKLFQPSLLGIWVLPAVLSFLTLIFAYQAARCFFSKTFSLAYLTLLVFSAWMVFFGRISHQAILLLLWQALAYWALGKFLQAPATRKMPWALGLGSLLGSGFYVYQAWPFVLVPIVAALWAGSRGPSRWSSYGTLLMAFIVGLPLALTALMNGYGTYLRDRFVLHSQQDWWGQIATILSGLVSFFWDNGNRAFFYGPTWGGFLDPILTTLFFLGFLKLYRDRGLPFSRWLLFAMATALLPLFLSKNLTDMREAAFLPLASLCALFGTQWCLEKARPDRRLLFLGLLFTAWAGLESIHIWKSRIFLNDYWGEQRSKYSWRTFQVLNDLRKRQGPGLFLDDLSHAVVYSKDFGNMRDQTLSTATYPFNAARNPRFSPGSAAWLALLVDPNDGPFLARRFPKGEGYWIGEKGSDPPGSGFLLWVLPAGPEMKGTFERWSRANAAFRRLTEVSMDLPESQPRQRILELMPDLYPSVQGDPLLESLYWKVVYANHNWEAVYGDHDRPRHFAAALDAIHHMLDQGYPTAYVYNELGGCLYVLKDRVGARKAFEKAVRSEVNDTPAAENLALLERGH